MIAERAACVARHRERMRSQQPRQNATDNRRRVLLKNGERNAGQDRQRIAPRNGEDRTDHHGGQGDGAAETALYPSCQLSVQGGELRAALSGKGFRGDHRGGGDTQKQKQAQRLRAIQEVWMKVRHGFSLRPRAKKHCRIGGNPGRCKKFRRAQ